MHQVGPWIDSLKLARAAYPELSSHKLEDLIHALNLDKKLKEIFNNEEHWHDAYFDTVACAILLEHLLKLDCFTGMSIEALSSIKTTDYYRKRKPST